MTRPRVAFVFDLVQDVTVLRPLAFLAARETEAEIRFLLSTKFAGRDPTGTWRRELADLARRVRAEVTTFEGPADTYMALQGGRGVILASSESDLPDHAVVHEVLRAAPPGYLRVTLQHGLECVGFLQNRAHDLAHGRRVGFAADVICTWMPERRLSALVPSQRAKVLVTGPSFLLSRVERATDHPPTRGGLVCENLHSVRLRASGDHGRPFMETFRAFAALLAAAGEPVTLRPHPAGHYVLRENAVLPPNVLLNNLPLYRVDLGAYGYGISAPSTILLDMVLAGIPVGVWQDPEGGMDLSNYEGLTPVRGIEDWVGFLRDARLRPEAILERQRVWLEGLGMPLEPAEVYRRFARLLVNATSHRDPARLEAVP